MPPHLFTVKIKTQAGNQQNYLSYQAGYNQTAAYCFSEYLFYVIVFHKRIFWGNDNSYLKMIILLFVDYILLLDY